MGREGSHGVSVEKLSTDPMFRITVGLPKPETAAEVQAHSTFRGMRHAMWNAGMRESALIRQCMETAHVMGLDGEDRYTLLAYHALRQLEDLWIQHRALSDLLPMPPFVLQRPKDPRND